MESAGMSFYILLRSDMGSLYLVMLFYATMLRISGLTFTLSEPAISKTILLLYILRGELVVARYI